MRMFMVLYFIYYRYLSLHIYFVVFLVFSPPHVGLIQCIVCGFYVKNCEPSCSPPSFSLGASFCISSLVAFFPCMYMCVFICYFLYDYLLSSCILPCVPPPPPCMSRLITSKTIMCFFPFPCNVLSMFYRRVFYLVYPPPPLCMSRLITSETLTCFSLFHVLSCFSLFAVCDN